MSAIFQNILVDLVLLFFPLAIVYKEKNFGGKKALYELGLKKIGLIELLKKTLAILFAMLAVSFVIVSIANTAGVNDLQRVGEAIGETLQTSLLLMLYLLTVRVFTEELFFRGFLVGRIGVFGSSLVFGLAHVFFGSVVEVIGAFALGLVLAIFFQKNKNIFPNIAAHFLYNILALVIFFGIAE